jgi:hypothetical protein
MKQLINLRLIDFFSNPLRRGKRAEESSAGPQRSGAYKIHLWDFVL